VIVSATALAAPHVPVVSFATLLDSKDSNSSKTTPFKNVFDSLTLAGDLQHEDGAHEESATVPNSSVKKELDADHISGTDEAVVLQAPIVPQTPSPNPPKPSLILPQPAHGAVPEKDATPDETPALQLAPSREPSDAASSLAVKSELAASATSLPYPALASSSLQSKARVDVPTSAPAVPVRSAISTKATAAPATPSKPQATAARPSLESQSSGKPEAASQLAPSTSEPTALPHLIAKTSTAQSVSMPPEPLTTEPVQEEPIKDQAIKVQAEPPEIALQAVSLPVRVSALAAQPSTSVVTEKPVGTKVTASRSSSHAPAPAPLQVSAGEDRSSTKAELPTVVSSASEPMADAKPTQPPAPQNAQTASPGETPLPVQAATPAPPPQPDAPSTPPANADPQEPARAKAAEQPTSAADSTVPPAESKPEPTLAAAVMAASTSSPAPLPAAHEDMDRASEPPSTSSALQREASSTTPAPKVPLVPQAEDFAFAVRMLGVESSASHSSLTQPSTSVTTNETPVTQSKAAVAQPLSPDSQQPAAPPSQTSSDPRHETQSTAPETEKSDTATQNLSSSLGTQQTPGVTPHWNDAAVFQAPEIGSISATPEHTEAVHTDLLLAAQEAHLLPPEMPKASATSEILLHLTGDDQSSAAIRIADRAGSVNVSVHASDPVLRESLRSNLGELSTQLNDQGWKTDVTKSAAVAAQSGSQQDSHTGGQQDSQQQQPFGGDRQPQRDRRANGGQWQQELDQQISGGDAHPGGNG